MPDSPTQRRTPSGWRWLLRCAIACSAVVLITAGAWMYWSHEADRRMDATIADLRAKGRMVRWADLKYDDVADEQNAASHIRAAWAAYVPSARSGAAIGTPAWQTAAQTEVTANAQALALARQARAFERVCWIRPTPGSNLPVIPQYTNASTFCRLLQSAALLHHQQGEEKQAIECWRDIEHIQRMMGKDSSTLITGLICMIESGIGSDAMIRIAPELRFGSPGGLDPADARTLMRELLDTDPIKNAVARGFRFEGVSATNFALTADKQACAGMLRPGFIMAMNRNVTLMQRAADECEHLRYSPPAKSPPASTPNLFNWYTPQFTNVAQDIIQEVLRRRLTAVTIALSLHRHETGRFPASLQELVPGYLPSVPMDPRNEDKTPLGYLVADGGRRPMLYSAGSDKNQVGQPPKQRADITGNAIPQTGVIWQDVTPPAK